MPFLMLSAAKDAHLTEAPPQTLTIKRYMMIRPSGEEHGPTTCESHPDDSAGSGSAAGSRRKTRITVGSKMTASHEAATAHPMQRPVMPPVDSTQRRADRFCGGACRHHLGRMAQAALRAADRHVVVLDHVGGAHQDEKAQCSGPVDDVGGAEDAQGEGSRHLGDDHDPPTQGHSKGECPADVAVEEALVA